MNKKHPKWPIVEDLAKAKGVSEYALEKWHQRGVPALWHTRLIIASKGALTIEDFAEDGRQSA